jgi:hypothetical protein
MTRYVVRKHFTDGTVAEYPAPHGVEEMMDKFKDQEFVTLYYGKSVKKVEFLRRTEEILMVATP